jgi:hypothetical protein
MADEPSTTTQPDYGPSLPQLLRPRLRALSRGPRILLGAAVILLIAGVAVLLVRQEASVATYAQSEQDARARGLEPIAFSFDHAATLRTSQPAGAYVVAERRKNGTLVARFTVSEFDIQPRPGLVSSYLPLIAGRVERDYARRFENFRLRFEGRARVNQVEGYQFAFSARLARPGSEPRQVFGRVVMLPEPYDLEQPDEPYPPGEAPKRGALITMLATSLDEATEPLQVGDTGVLQRPFRSFRFG